MKLIITVEFLCGRYHGRNRDKEIEHFPPSPMRLFQALIAASHRGSYGLQNAAVRDNALQWLERLAPPLIVAGEAHLSSEDATNFVPNNDNRTKENRFSHVRTAKSMQCQVLAGDNRVKYVWNFDETEAARNHAQVICAIARLITHLGQTVDLTVANGEIAEDFAADNAVVVLEPGDDGGEWQIPASGTLAACQARYRQKLNVSSGHFVPSRWFDYRNRNALHLYQPRALYELRKADGTFWSCDARFLSQAAAMTRHAWIDFFKQNSAFAERHGSDLIVQKVCGHESDSSSKPLDAPHLAFVPLPSLNESGTADGKIRRVLVVGYGCETGAARRMFSDAASKIHGKPLVDEMSAREIGELSFVENVDGDTVARLFSGANSRPRKIWRTVTPIISSGLLKRGRRPETVVQKCLREAGISLEAVESIAAFKSPLIPKTLRAMDYKPPERLTTTPRYHAEIVFKKPVAGSLVVGRGRFVGFGLLMPWR